MPKLAAVNLKENAPYGSYEYERNTLHDALKAVQLFPGVDYYSVYLMYVYPEKILVGVKDKYYEISYSKTSEDVVSFGKPVEVEQYYAPKEVKEAKVEPKNKAKSVEDELKESGVAVVEKAVNIDFELDFIPLQEKSINEDGEIEVVLIEAGTNHMKKRHYPKSTIKEVADKFAGVKMYMDHPTEKQEKEKPERSLRDWVSTITESWYEDGKAMGKVKVHDEWLKERLKDPVARKHIGLSINAGGKISKGKVDGKDNYQIVEKIVLEKQNGLASVDWVTEAGARGRVSRLLKESKGEKSMELKEATFEDLQRENPALVNSLKESILKDLKASEEMTKKDTELKEAKAKLAEFDKKEKAKEQESKIDAWLKEAKSVPEQVKARVKSGVCSKIYEGETELKEAYNASLKSELEYFNQISPKGRIQAGGGSSTTEAEGSKLVESFSKDLEKRMGVGEVEKKDKDQK